MSKDADVAVLKELQRMPNVGPAMAGDLVMLGIRRKEDLVGKDPDALYDRLSEMTGQRQDPCVADTFQALVSHATTGDPRPWFAFTAERKERWLKAGRK